MQRHEKSEKNELMYLVIYITYGETCVSYFPPERKRTSLQSMHHGKLPILKKAKIHFFYRKNNGNFL